MTLTAWQIQKCFDLIQCGDGLLTIFLSLTLGKDQNHDNAKTTKHLHVIYWNGKFHLKVQDLEEIATQN